MIVLLPVLVLVAGLILWIINTPSGAMWADVGRLMFFAGMLAFLLAGAEQVVTFLNK